MDKQKCNGPCEELLPLTEDYFRKYPTGTHARICRQCMNDKRNIGKRKTDDRKWPNPETKLFLCGMR